MKKTKRGTKKEQVKVTYQGYQAAIGQLTKTGLFEGEVGQMMRSLLEAPIIQYIIMIERKVVTNFQVSDDCPVLAEAIRRLAKAGFITFYKFRPDEGDVPFKERDLLPNHRVMSFRYRPEKVIAWAGLEECDASAGPTSNGEGSHRPAFGTISAATTPAT